MTVYETTIPGVGRKYEIDIADGQLDVVIHHDGKRDVYSETDDQTDHLLTLTDRQAREVASVLEGSYFQPVELDSVEVPLGEAFIEWHEVPDDSPLAGQTFDAADVRESTGATVLAVQRGAETHPSPDPDFRVEAGDVLVVLGSRQEQAATSDLVDAD